jgi:hypothetical protein
MDGTIVLNTRPIRGNKVSRIFTIVEQVDVIHCAFSDKKEMIFLASSPSRFGSIAGSSI